LVKKLKNPIVDTLWIEENVHIAWESMKNKSTQEIKSMKKEVAENQIKWFWRSALNNEYFTKFFWKYWINRAWVDYQTAYPSIYETDINIDIYYPYALIFVWRLCDTSAIENIKRWYYAIDEVCPRTCWKFDMFIKNFQTAWYKLLQRWNAQYKSQIELNISQQVVDKYENRLIYTPLI